MICGKPVAVRAGLTSADAAIDTREMQLRKLFVSNLPSEMQEEQVQNLFESFGKVTKILIPKGGIKRRNFCYVIMQDTLVFNDIVRREKLLYQGQSIKVEPAVVAGQIRTPKKPAVPHRHSTQGEAETTTCSSDSKYKSQFKIPSQKQSVVASKCAESPELFPIKRDFLKTAIPDVQQEQNYRFNLIRKTAPISILTAPQSSQISSINSHPCNLQMRVSRNPAILPQSVRTLYRPF